MTRLRLTLEKYPDNHGKSSRHKDMSFTEVMAYEAERAAKEGRDLGTLGLSTLDRHWRAVKALMEWVSAQDGVPSIDANRLFGRHTRSEEHTSELQSLMRISYAVFCLKKKKPKTRQDNTHYSI